NDAVQLERKPSYPSCIDDILVPWIPVEDIDSAFAVAHPGEVVFGYRPVGTDAGHEDFEAAPETGAGVGHALACPNHQIGKGDPGIDLDERSPVGPADDHVFRRMGIMGNEALFEARRSLWAYLSFKLFPGIDGVGPQGTYGPDPVIRYAGPVEPVEHLGNHQVHRRRPLQV